MPYGILNQRQQMVVRTYVEGLQVHDLGAGDLILSRKLLDLGAASVIAIEKELSEGRKATRDPRITCVEGYFHAYRGTRIETAFVSWPCNWPDQGLIRLLVPCPVIIYLGTNLAGTMCGGSDLFCHLIEREVLAYEPDRHNTLIVYGPGRVERPLRGEEKAALNTDHMWSFEESERG